MLVIASGIAVAAATLGTLVSFHIDGATGACIVLIQAFFFLLAFLFAPQRGLLMRARSVATTSAQP
jgi:manganese/iron transport system permease protein